MREQRREVLVVEDDALLRSLLVRALGDEGYAVTAAASAREAAARFRRSAPDLLVLDIVLPDGDGRDLCRALRGTGSRAAVLFLSGRTTVGDRIAGFGAGGDDYLTKPFELAELVVRLRALARRTSGAPAPPAERKLTMDAAALAVEAGGRRVGLTPTEFRLLAALLARPREIVRRAELVEAAWAPGAIVHDNTLDVYIARLRRKLRPLATAPRISAARGIGYRTG